MNVSQVLASEASRKSKLVAGWFPRPGIRKTGMISVNHAVEIHTTQVVPRASAAAVRAHVS